MTTTDFEEAATRFWGDGEPGYEEQGPDGENPTKARIEQLRSLLVTTDGLDGIPEPEPLIDGMLFLDSLAWLWGPPGNGKSFVALDWSACIAQGIPWDLRGTRRGQVLYLVAEGVSGIRKRVRAWEHEFRVPMAGVTFLPAAVQMINGIDRSALIEIVKELRPVLVVIDTQARATVGVDENSNTDAGKVVDAAEKIREASGACVLMVHHSGKSGLDMRGASAYKGAATSEIKVTKDGDWIDVLCEKQKDVEDFAPIRLRLKPVQTSCVLTATDDPAATTALAVNATLLLDVMRQSFGSIGASSTQLKAAAGLADRTFYRELSVLVDRGLITRTGSDARPRYYLPEDAPPLITANAANAATGSD
ncbi:AAA family ATPase [Streptomyces sp. CB01201]|uniref:AAA family ATPase n=1 Tax=Streptomyces sp. CB01201 TaxID=2020324 RepID=UPI00131B92F7|nr:AAA family ATPase [Streptomyces sp. CB01201]